MVEVIGIDFDNTLVCYDRPFEQLAQHHGFAARGKRAVREAFRSLPEGDVAWQRIQAEVYGPRILEAEPFPGVSSFLEAAHQQGCVVHVISHKTQVAPYGDPAVNLREQALRWLDLQGLLEPSRTGLTADHVHFGGTRREKLAWMGRCGCTVFIDDLEETFLEPTFPVGVRKFLFDPMGSAVGKGWERACCSWEELRMVLLGVA